MDDVIYVKDIVNWKLYNYIIGKMTIYEDAGYLIQVQICIKISLANNQEIYHALFAYDSNPRFLFDTESITKSLLKWYNTNGIFYKIQLYKKPFEINNEFLIKQIITVMCDKFKIVHFDNNINEIILQEK